MPQAIETLFPKFEVFEFLLEEDYETLEQFMFRYQYDEGQYVFKEGAHGGYMFFIVEGEVEVESEPTALHVFHSSIHSVHSPELERAPTQAQERAPTQESGTRANARASTRAGTRALRIRRPNCDSKPRADCSWWERPPRDACTRWSFRQNFKSSSASLSPLGLHCRPRRPWRCRLMHWIMENARKHGLVHKSFGRLFFK